MTQKDVFDQMADKWPSAIVVRTEIEKFSGGLISAKYCANLDSIHQGAPRVTIGRKVGYPVNSLIDWLRQRSN